jgi:prefoldin subunit 5
VAASADAQAKLILDLGGDAQKKTSAGRAIALVGGRTLASEGRSRQVVAKLSKDLEKLRSIIQQCQQALTNPLVKDPGQTNGARV